MKARENRNLISDNLELFDIVRRVSGEGKDILFSHAGVRTAWVDSFAGLWGEDGFNPETLNEIDRRPREGTKEIGA